MAKPKATPAARAQLNPTQMIPLNQLRVSPSNVRSVYDVKTIEVLAEDIARRGLLQSLLVRPCGGAEDGTPYFEVPAGGRRMRALELLVTTKRLAADAPIPCIVKSDGVAEDDSLAENTMREALHPVEEFRAMAQMVDKGMTIAEVAASHRVTGTYVKQRLRLASVSPKLLELALENKLTLDQLMAFCLTEDHTRQESVYAQIEQAQPWERDASSIRELLTENAVPANDRRVRFVGLKAYQKAGGYVQRDLFNDSHDGYLTDVDLLNTLVADKLAAEKAKVEAEGWGWVVSAVEVPYSEKSGMQRLMPKPLSEEDEARAAALEEERDGFYDLEGDLTKAQQKRLDAVEAELDAIENAPSDYKPEDKQRGGAFVSLAHDGSLNVDRGYLRREDVAPDNAKAAVGAGADVGHEPDGVKPLSESLVQDLTSYRTVALRNALAKDYRVAMLAALHAMCLNHFYRTSYEGCLQLRLDPSFPSDADGLDGWGTTQEVKARDESLRAMLPETSSDLWDTLMKMGADDQRRLFAHCVAGSLNAVRQRGDRSERIRHADQVARALGFNMVAAGWSTNAENYLSRVSKAHILEAVTEARGEDKANLLADLKKQGMVIEAERLLSGTGWLPEPLRTADDVGAVAEEGDDLAGPAELPAFLTDGSTESAAA